jgi:methionyl-tRNA formyltransferase
MGTPDFAVPSLSSLVENKKDVIAVVTQPDRPRERGGKRDSPPLKKVGLKYGLRVEQARDVNEPDFVTRLKELKPDIIIVVSFGQILSPRILEISGEGCLNVHPSLLPKYRGAAPINWVLLKGEAKTGVTTFYMNEKMDAGDMILQEEMEIASRDNVATLGERLAELGAGVLLKTLELIEKGEVTPKIQNEEEATYAPRLKKGNGLIDWKKSAFQIHNLARGTNPWPGAFTYIKIPVDNSEFSAQRLKVLETEVLECRIPNIKHRTPGEIVDILKDKGFLVITGEGYLLIKEIQPENKRRMSSGDYLHGHRVEVGMRLGDFVE